MVDTPAMQSHFRFFGLAACGRPSATGFTGVLKLPMIPTHCAREQALGRSIPQASLRGLLPEFPVRDFRERVSSIRGEDARRTTSGSSSSVYPGVQQSSVRPDPDETRTGDLAQRRGREIEAERNAP